MEQEFKKLKKDFELLAMRFGNHKHSGTDGQLVWYTNIFQKKIYIPYVISDGSITTNYGVFFIAPFPCTITGFTETHATAGTDLGSVTLQLEKLLPGEASGTGQELLVNGDTSFNGINLKGTVDTPVFYPENVIQPGATYPNTFTQEITNNIRDINLKKGDRVGLKVLGTPTSVAGISVLLELTFN